LNTRLGGSQSRSCRRVAEKKNILPLPGFELNVEALPLKYARLFGTSSDASYPSRVSQNKFNDLAERGKQAVVLSMVLAFYSSPCF
jgi:hypothetical protein